MTERDKHGDPISERQYSPAEIAAARKLGVCDSGHGRGTIYFAGGDWWPNHLDALAREYELQARRARVVAKALRREQARWPLTDAKVLTKIVSAIQGVNIERNENGYPTEWGDL